MVKNPPDSAGYPGDRALIPGSGRCPGGGLGSPLQYSCLENFAWSIAWRILPVFLPGEVANTHTHMHARTHARTQSECRDPLRLE